MQTFQRAEEKKNRNKYLRGKTCPTWGFGLSPMSLAKPHPKVKEIHLTACNRNYSHRGPAKTGPTVNMWGCQNCGVCSHDKQTIEDWQTDRFSPGYYVWVTGCMYDSLCTTDTYTWLCLSDWKRVGRVLVFVPRTGFGMEAKLLPCIIRQVLY